MAENNKSGCVYCGCITVDDSRGNCSACGAPREIKPEIVRPSKVFTNISATTSAATFTWIPTDRINEWVMNE